MDKQFTPRQRHIENLINSIGYRTELEVPYPPYIVDIEVPELGFIVEVDGPQHYKKEKNKRDAFLLAKYGETIMDILHVPVGISDSDFRKEFSTMVEKNYGSSPIGNRN